MAEVDKCVWCCKTIYLDQPVVTDRAGDEVVYYHVDCFDKAKHSLGYLDDVTLEGCYTGQGD